MACKTGKMLTNLWFVINVSSRILVRCNSPYRIGGLSVRFCVRRICVWYHFVWLEMDWYGLAAAEEEEESAGTFRKLKIESVDSQQCYELYIHIELVYLLVNG